MVMADAGIHVAEVHDRMPVILQRQDWVDRLAGVPSAAKLLCRSYPELIVVKRTTDAWARAEPHRFEAWVNFSVAIGADSGGF